MLDLDRVVQIINRPHIVDLRDDGFTLMHPPACHPRLFECEYNLAARDNLTDPGKRGQYLCELVRDVDSGDLWFIVGHPAPDYEGVPWNDLVAELRAAREAAAIIPPQRLRMLADWLDLQDDKRQYGGDREVQRDLRRLAAAYDQATKEST